MLSLDDVNGVNGIVEVLVKAEGEGMESPGQRVFCALPGF
jgi:hypothetical protein